MPGKPLIDKLNSSWAKARTLTDQADSKRAKAREKDQARQDAERDQLIDEAANLYGEASAALEEAAHAAEQLAQLKTPSWYTEYFTLQARLMHNLAYMGAAAKEELQIRRAGAPTAEQLQTWKEDLKRLKKENDELYKQIANIEARERSALLKH